MGEVYRATDTKLGRDVAIKVLPEAFAADPDRLSRFEREAKLLASLNHTGIAHVPARRNGRGAAGGEQASTAGGIMPVWRSDGKELYYLNPVGAMMAVPMTLTGAALEPGAPASALFPTRIFGVGVDTGGRQYDVGPDGRFLINTVLDSAATPITLVQNWNPALKK